MKNHRCRRWLWLLALTAGLAACKEPPAEAGGEAGKLPRKVPRASATRVEVATVELSLPTLRLARPGEVIGAREAQLASALGGFVETVPIKAGQFVRKGAQIARVDRATHQAQAQLARVEVDAATREFKRLDGLGNAVASARVDQARTALERAKAQRRIQQLRVDRAVVRAPFSGVIADLDVEQGEVVAPGKTLARLIQVDPVHVSVSVSDVDVSLLAVGGAAAVSTVSSPRPLEGRIARIDPAADLDTRTFLVRVEVSNKQRALRPGMIARVEFSIEGLKSGSSPAKQTLLPQDLLVTRQGENGVFVVDERSVAHWRKLTLGQIVRGQVIVDKGLAAGERIVVVGHRALSDGDLLMVAREGRCCPGGRVRFDAASPSAVSQRATPAEQVAQ